MKITRNVNATLWPDSMAATIKDRKRYPRGTQKRQIIDYLIGGGRINHMDAVSWFGCARLASRIEELRDDKWPIESHPKNVNGKRFVSYKLRDSWFRK